MNAGALLTKTINLTICLILLRSPTARFSVAIKSIAIPRAAVVPSSVVRFAPSRPTQGLPSFLSDMARQEDLIAATHEGDEGCDGWCDFGQLDPQRRDSLIYGHEPPDTSLRLHRPPCTVSEYECSYHNSCILEICYVQEVCENRLKAMSRCTCGSPNALPTRLPMAFFVREIAYPHSEGSVKNRA